MLQLFRLVLAVGLLALAGCPGPVNNNNNNPPIDTTQNPTGKGVKGIGLLNRLPGIWSGTLTSSRLPGVSGQTWVADWRPIAPGAVVFRNELDAQNDIYFGIMVAKRGNDSLLVFRNGGLFSGMNRTSYLKLDSAVENGNTAFYRFVDMVKGASRLYSTFSFDANGLTVETYSNGQFHMKWAPSRLDTSAMLAAKAKHAFPKPVPALDLTGAFDGKSDAVCFDPEPSCTGLKLAQHPEVGSLKVTVSKSSSLNLAAGKNVMLVLSTQPIFNGFTPQPAAIEKRSRYVILKNWDPSSPVDFTFGTLHPGTYYLNAIYSNSISGAVSTGDALALLNDKDKQVVLSPQQAGTAGMTIDFVIP